MRKSDLTAEHLKEILHYNPTTGIWTWLKTAANKRRFVGGDAGSVDSKGYPIIKINSSLYKSHRFAWLYMTGGWPMGDLDHRDRDPSNCRWENLRQASRVQNNINNEKNLGRSGLKGAAWSENDQKWKSSIRVNGNRIHLGYFDDAQQAHEVYRQASLTHHGEWSTLK